MRLPQVSPDQHLHWTQPLILGGSTTVANTSVLDRNQHLVGHARLWRQIGNLPPGSSVVPR